MLILITNAVAMLQLLSERTYNNITWVIICYVLGMLEGMDSPKFPAYTYIDISRMSYV